MSNDTSEEKTEKATSQKLRKERERGRALTAADTVAAVVVAAVILAIVMMVQRTASEFSLLFDTAFEAGGKPDIDRLRDVWTIFGRVVSTSALILLGLASVVGILANIVIKKGFVFSAENIAPNFDRLNPATNLQNMFAKRALIEFLASSLRFFAWLAAAGFLIVSYTPALIVTFSLDLSTTLHLFILVFGSFLLLAAVFMALTSAIDLPVQRYLFDDDMRMTKTELRREQKDSFGDPKLVAERKRLTRAGLNNPVGIRMTSFVAIGDQGAVGIHYIHGKTDVPYLTVRADRSGVARLKAMAKGMGIPVVKNRDLVRLLATGVDVGDDLVGTELVEPFTDAYVASVRA
ncbi:EscU/YscU/HrcU family type III secretion system export apparatus switch protein [Tabrizicola aquatica]|uniref:EscU/YscU/HrcU family type III secretion system export apparatus switch protein n=1 Tax=Tabrizicola aquatica TaxID=909926 RepID=UPI000CD1D98B|nr:EscU/YscU/HrcU family type III secretion system export apparatus switch protein [Tabrizicola aquatica]